MAAPQKDTIYIDVDDEITSIIEKVQASPGKVVALVLPKRATVFQSVVNMKLLKRTAAASKKHIVLITSEAGLLPLAGAVGVHVAKTLQSKPEVPEAPAVSDTPVSVDEDQDAQLPTDIDKTRPIGELNRNMGDDDQDESIEVDNDGDTATDTSDQKTVVVNQKSSKNKVAFNKKLKIPNFDKFRVRLFLSLALVVLLIAGWALAYIVLPKAQIIIRTNNTDVMSSMTLTASPKAKTVDDAQMIVPAALKQYKKTETQKVAATGKKDEGTKATGKATLTLADCSQDQITIPANTSLTANNFAFVTQADVILKSVKIGSSCQNSSFPDFSTATVNVAAQNPGDQYNLSARSYTVSGFSNVNAAGSAMAGGTSKIVTVVAQSDVDSAKQKVLDAANSTANQTLVTQLKAEGYLPLSETFAAGDPLVTASPNVGDTANEVTVTVAVTYAMTGAQRDSVKQLLEKDITRQIDTKTQKILDNGLEKAVVHVTNKATSGDVAFTLQSAASAGVQQDVSEIKKQVAGKKRNEVKTLLTARPGVKDVTITYSPFWVYKTPNSVSKIHVTFQQNNGKAVGGQ